ncbi:MAG: MFS transporter [Legionellaceae bacterium]
MGFMIGAPLSGYISDHLRRRKLPMVVGAVGASCLMALVLYVPDLNEHTLDALMFTLGLLYSVQALVFAVGRELSPAEAAGTAIAMTNTLVMIGAMFLQPLVGHLLDWSFMYHQTPGQLIDLENIKQLYTAHDYQLALSIIPIGIFSAAVLTYFLKETHGHARKNPH